MTTLPHGALDPRTREEIAQVEIGQTTITPGLARGMMAAFLLICCASGAFELTRVARGNEAALRPWVRLHAVIDQTSAGWRSDPGPDAQGALQRTWRRLLAANRAVLEGLHEFEKSLEDESRLAGSLRPGAQLLLSGRLGAGNEQAYVGRDGWLFYRADVEYVTGPGFLDDDVRLRRIRGAAEWTDPPQPDPRPAIFRLHRDLAARGIALIVVPVPVKPTIHPEMLATVEARAAPQNPDYQPLLDEIRRAGITVVDPASLLAQAKITSGATQYLATDTHWRPEAMEMVAEALAGSIRQTVTLPSAGDPGYRIEPVDITGRGDIFNMLDLPASQTLVCARKP